MSHFTENLGHFANGMIVMFFVLASIHLYRHRNKNSLMKFFFWTMACFAFIELINAIYLIDYFFENSYVSNITATTDMWSIPLTAAFMFEILSPGWIRWRRILLMMLPTVSLTFLYIFFPYDILAYISIAYGYLLGTVTVIIVFMASSKYDNYIKKNFSYTENLSLYWLRWIIAPLYLALFIWTLVTWNQNWQNEAFYYFFLTAIWMFIYFRTVKHVVVEVPDLLNPFIKEEEKEEEATASERNKSNNYSLFAQKLEKCVEKEKLYLNPQLTIMELANCIGTNRTYLSDYLHKQLNTNFYEYINTFRIKEACSILVSDNFENLESLAETCGFNSLSTFRRAFIKETGKTPLQYREK